MQPLQIVILVLESANVLATGIFLFMFIKRLCKINTMSVTNRFIDKHWVLRVVFAAVYIIFSASLLTIELIKYVNQTNWTKQLLMSGSVGFCINSLNLIAHIIVISKQLRKEMPYTRLHQIFLIYLVSISFCRLGVVIYQFWQSSGSGQYQIILLSLAILITLISAIMLICWIRLKKSMPNFDDFSNVDINTLTQRFTNPLIPHHGSIYPQKNSIQKWNLIIPNITVELGKVRIILQILTEDQILKSLAQQSTKYNSQALLEKPEQNLPKSQTLSLKQKSQHHLQIISDHYYSISQIKSIYLFCSQFEIANHVHFDGVSMADFYRQIKRFIQELFTVKQAYSKQIFHMFKIDKKTIQQINSKVAKMIKFQDELQVSNFVDLNCMFLSIQVFKHLWVEDHFIFYIHTISMDKNQSVVCYKRYNQFQQFHNKLEESVCAEFKNTYKMVPLPKKHYFSWTNEDVSKVVQRRQQLQNYCQQTFNDYTVMSKMPRSRQMIFNFLNLRNTFDITPNLKKICQFYDGIQVRRGNIYKAISDGDYVTFYQFQLFRNGILIRNIVKRFRQFVRLHLSLQRWMENQQILYKFIVLPEKHLYKSETKRQQKLTQYLKNVISIKQAFKIYAVNRFFEVGHKYNADNSGFGMSIIKRQPSISDSEIQQQKHQSQAIHHRKSLIHEHGDIDFNRKSQHDFSMESQKQRMSLLIQGLGDGDD